MNKKKGSFRKKFLTGLLYFLLTGTLAIAEEINLDPYLEQTLEQKTNNFKIFFKYRGEDKSKNIKYLTSYSYFDRLFNNLRRGSNVPALTSFEENEVESMIVDIKNGNINSYSNFIESSKNFSENQKIVLLSAIGYLLGKGSYDYSDPHYEVLSQDTFFNKLQDYLDTGDKNPLGNCRHIASHLEKLANDMGISAAVVLGMERDGIGHAQNILKTENGTTIISYGDLFVTDTKNIEESLKAYQKNLGAVTFKHLFFNDDKLEYYFITKDGKHFLEFTEYDETLKTLKDSLFNKDIPKDSDLTFMFDNKKNYLASAGFNYGGFLMKAGQIRGDSSSPLNKMNLCQIGFKRKFPLKYVNINPNLNLLIGNLIQDSKLENNYLIGMNGDLSITTNFEKGLNLASKISQISIGLIPISNSPALFFDFNISAGMSYKIPAKKVDIHPYAILQLAFFPKDLGTYKHKMKLSEFTTGIKMDLNTDPYLSTDLYYIGKMRQYGFGGNIKVGNKNFETGLGGYVTWSNYEFCPDKYNFNLNSKVNLKNMSLGFDYKLDGTNYDGETDTKSSFDIQTEFKF